MCSKAFRKQLARRPLSHQERATLTPDELYVLAVVGRIDRLTDREREKMGQSDLDLLRIAGILPGGAGAVEALAAGPGDMPCLATS